MYPEGASAYYNSSDPITAPASAVQPRVQHLSGGEKLFLAAAAALAIYGWWKSPAQIKLWLFLIFFGIPIPALLISNVSLALAAALLVVWLVVFVAGLVQVVRLTIWQQQANYQAALAQQQAEEAAVVQDGIRKVRYDHTLAQVTGEAVATAMMRKRPPESPTGAPQRPTEPKPTPPAPMGSTTPTLWIPTYQGPRKELQRRETSLDGVWMNDYRGVDPDDL
jgi:hypothetical protein